MATPTLLSLTTVAALLLVGCGTPTSPGHGQTPTADERLAWYRGCWQAFNAAKFDQFGRCYDDKAQAQQSGYGKPDISGREAIVAGARDFKKTFPDGRGEEVITLINGTRIMSVHVLHGTNTGPLTDPNGKSVAATGKPFGLMFGHLIQAAPDANIVQHELGIMDAGTLDAQLGLSKAPSRTVINVSPIPVTTVKAANDAKEQANLKSEQAIFDAWNKHDEDTFESLIDDNYVCHCFADPSEGDFKSQRASNQGLWRSFSDAQLSTHLWAAGDYVVAQGELTGTNDGPIPSIAVQATGNHVEVPYLQLDRFENGKLREEWLFYNVETLAAQIAPGTRL
jgi:predicted ester cyclase